MKERGEHYIDNLWVKGQGKQFASQNPADDTILWEGQAASQTQVDAAVTAAHRAFPTWANLPFEKKLEYLSRFQKSVEEKRSSLKIALSKDNGKPLWEADAELGGLSNKITLSIQSYQERCPERYDTTSVGLRMLKHKPHGVLSILGPFNFPVHVPHGHIIPALIAGNTLVFKPSELTPYISECIMQCWEEAKLPSGVINLIQGGGEVGKYLTQHPLINGVLFTGSSNVGIKLLEQFSRSPEKIISLEMGGNNALIVNDIVNKIDEAVYHTIQSAYVTSGQRCTCARRLIVIKNKDNEKFVSKLCDTISELKIGSYESKPQPFMGPLISKNALEHVLSAYEVLIKQGAKPLVTSRKIGEMGAFLSPGLLDVTDIKSRSDEEIFGPILQLIWVNDFEEAMKEANRTEYGLVAGLLSSHEQDFQIFYSNVRAGLLNWNMPLTGASSYAPFGGIGKSGNFRPTAYYAADYCSYPVASLCEDSLRLPSQLPPGIVIK